MFMASEFRTGFGVWASQIAPRAYTFSEMKEWSGV